MDALCTFQGLSIPQVSFISLQAWKCCNNSCTTLYRLNLNHFHSVWFRMICVQHVHDFHCFHSDSQRSKLFVLRLFQTWLCCPVMTELVAHHAATIGAAFGEWCVHAPRLNSLTVGNFWTVDAPLFDYLEDPRQPTPPTSGVLLRDNHEEGREELVQVLSILHCSKVPRIFQRCHSGYCKCKCINCCHGSPRL